MLGYTSMGEREWGSQKTGRLLISVLSLLACYLPAPAGQSPDLAHAPDHQTQGPSEQGQEAVGQHATVTTPATTWVQQCPAARIHPGHDLPLPPEHDAFIAAAVAGLRRGLAVHIYGEPGLGKASLARQILQAVQEQTPALLPINVAWANAQDRAPTMAVHNLTAQACIPQWQQVHPLAAAVARLRHHLIPRSDLLVLEGITLPPQEPSEQHESWACGLQDVGRIYISEHAEDLDCDEPSISIELKPSSPASCIAQFATLVGADDATPLATAELCERLGQNPLAVHLAAHAFLTQRRPLDRWLRELSRHGLGRRAHRYNTAQRVEKLVDEALREATLPAVNLYTTLGALPKGSPIPEGLLEAALGLQNRAALQELAELGLVTLDPKHSLVFQHPLLQADAARRLAQSPDAAQTWQRLTTYLEDDSTDPSLPITLAALHSAILDRLTRNIRGHKARVSDAQQVRWTLQLSDTAVVQSAPVEAAEDWLEAGYDAAQREQQPKAALQLALALGERLSLASHTAGAIDWFERALRDATALKDQGLQRVLLSRLGQEQLRLGLVRAAIGNYLKARQLAQQLNDKRAQAQCLCDLAKAYLDQGDSNLALTHLRKALHLIRQGNDPRQEAIALGYLGVAYRDLGEVYHAIEQLEHALDLARSSGDRHTEALQHLFLGDSYRLLGQLKTAIDHRTRGLHLAQRLGELAMQSQLLQGLGNAYADLDEHARAIQYYEKALGLARLLGDHVGESTLLLNLAHTHLALGGPKTALPHYQRALDGAVRLGDRLSEGSLHEELGQLLLMLNEAQAAIPHLEAAVANARLIKDQPSEAARLEALARAHAMLGDEQRAREYAEAAQTLPQDPGKGLELDMMLQ